MLWARISDLKGVDSIKTFRSSERTDSRECEKLSCAELFRFSVERGDRQGKKRKEKRVTFVKVTFHMKRLYR